MYKIDRRGGLGGRGVQKSFTRTDPISFEFVAKTQFLYSFSMMIYEFDIIWILRLTILVYQINLVFLCFILFVNLCLYIVYLVYITFSLYIEYFYIFSKKPKHLKRYYLNKVNVCHVTNTFFNNVYFDIWMIWIIL